VGTQYDLMLEFSFHIKQNLMRELASVYLNMTYCQVQIKFIVIEFQIAFFSPTEELKRLMLKLSMRLL
jgi:hypothetical protein